MYGCGSHCDRRANCGGEGYRDFNCNCKCPPYDRNCGSRSKNKYGSAARNASYADFGGSYSMAAKKEHAAADDPFSHRFLAASDTAAAADDPAFSSHKDFRSFSDGFPERRKGRVWHPSAPRRRDEIQMESAPFSSSSSSYSSSSPLSSLSTSSSSSPWWRRWFEKGLNEGYDSYRSSSPETHVHHYYHHYEDDSSPSATRFFRPDRFDDDDDDHGRSRSAWRGFWKHGERRGYHHHGSRRHRGRRLPSRPRRDVNVGKILQGDDDDDDKDDRQRREIGSADDCRDGVKGRKSTVLCSEKHQFSGSIPWFLRYF